jgi:hypothetical protein
MECSPVSFEIALGQTYMTQGQYGM